MRSGRPREGFSPPPALRPAGAALFGAPRLLVGGLPAAAIGLVLYAGTLARVAAGGPRSAPGYCGASPVSGAVAVVILTWNGRDDTLACLRSLASVESPPLLPIVVDNGSSDGTADAVRRRVPRRRADRDRARTSGSPAETTPASARALELGASHVLVLNNDVEVGPGFVTALLEEASRHPDAGALCTKILFASPPGLIWFAGARFDPRSGYNGRQRGYREPDDGRFDEVVETDRACGAAMLIPREVLEEVGLFDAELFLYVEDTDWSLRARAAGYRALRRPGSRGAAQGLGRLGR